MFTRLEKKKACQPEPITDSFLAMNLLQLIDLAASGEDGAPGSSSLIFGTLNLWHQKWQLLPMLKAKSFSLALLTSDVSILSRCQ